MKNWCIKDILKNTNIRDGVKSIMRESRNMLETLKIAKGLEKGHIFMPKRV